MVEVPVVQPIGQRAADLITTAAESDARWSPLASRPPRADAQAPPAFGAPRLYHQSGGREALWSHGSRTPPRLPVGRKGWAGAAGDERGAATGAAMGGGWDARAAADTPERRAPWARNRRGRGAGAAGSRVEAARPRERRRVRRSWRPTPMVGVNDAEPPSVTTIDGPAASLGWVGVGAACGPTSRMPHAVVSVRATAPVTNSRRRRRAECGSFLPLSCCRNRVAIGLITALLLAYESKRRGGAGKGQW